MRRILVHPADLIDLSGQLRRSGTELSDLAVRALGEYHQLDLEVRGMAAVGERLYQLERLLQVQGPELERLSRFLELKATAFHEADTATEQLRPALPLPVGMVVACSPLSLAPKARESRPRWLHYSSALLKTGSGILGTAGGITLMTTIASPAGLVLVPVGVMGVLHGLGDGFEGFHELVTGKDQPNFTEQLYQGFMGEEKGSQVYQAVDWALMSVDVGMGAKGLLKAGDRLLLEVVKEGGTLMIDLANKKDVLGLLYEHLGGEGR